MLYKIFKLPLLSNCYFHLYYHLRLWSEKDAASPGLSLDSDSAILIKIMSQFLAAGLRKILAKST